ncbi:glycosyltransferase [Clostridium celatum]|uniref:glycosyltransferase n=1 Tax=Clostridium celatum TaxID=36834 RepID=UPI001897EBF2|nr:glycosyltransferase [Clostridium celatum]
MKKILFAINHLKMGGIEKTLINLINEIDFSKYEVTIFVLKKEGECINLISDKVNIIEFENYEKFKKKYINNPRIVILDSIKKLKIIKSLNLIACYLVLKIFNYPILYYNEIMKYTKCLDDIYDLVIDYEGVNPILSFFVKNNTKGEKKAIWVHFDYNLYPINKKIYNYIYKYFNNIVVVCNNLGDILKVMFPRHKEKLKTIYNVIDSKRIVELANKEKNVYSNYCGIKVLTIGRLVGQKGQDIVIPILHRLRKEGYNIKWFCVGEGKSRPIYENMIKEYNLEDEFCLLGNKMNPYPYIRECDIYVQPSRYEGYCTTTNEAKILNKPIITTNVSGANEQFLNNFNGIIVDINEESIYIAIKKLLDNKEILTQLQENLKIQNVSTCSEVEKVYELI